MAGPKQIQFKHEKRERENGTKICLKWQKATLMCVKGLYEFVNKVEV